MSRRRRLHKHLTNLNLKKNVSIPILILSRSEYDHSTKDQKKQIRKLLNGKGVKTDWWKENN